MEVVITHEDVEKAEAAFKRDPEGDHGGVSTYCPVHQALKRLGVPVARVGYTSVCCAESDVALYHEKLLPMLPREALKVTQLLPEDWARAEGMKFDYDWSMEAV